MPARKNKRETSHDLRLASLLTEGHDLDKTICIKLVVTIVDSYRMAGNSQLA